MELVLNGQYLATAFCLQGMERKWNRLTEEEARAGTERSLTAYVVPIYQVTSFKYLGLVLAEVDNDWPEVVRNIRRARQKWV